MDWFEQKQRELANRAKKRYDKASRNIDARMRRYLKQNQKVSDELMASFSDGEISEREFKKRMAERLFSGKKWTAEKEKQAEILYEANRDCIYDLNDAMDELYIESFNRESYATEKHYLRDIGMTLMTIEALNRLKKKGKVDIPYKTIDRAKDMAWNAQRIQREITNAIEIGEGILGIWKNALTGLSKRGLGDIENVIDYSTRAVRALGEYESMLEAEKLGIEIEKEWISTLDKHTRETHRDLDGQRQALHDPFEIDGYELMYPRDPNGAPEMIINCRCTMKRIYPKYENIPTERRENLKRTGEDENKIIPETTYRQWEKSKHD